MAEPENATVPESESAEPKKKSKLRLLLILGVAILVAGGGGFLAIKYFRAPKPASADTKAGVGEPANGNRVKSIMNLDVFLVNLADTEATRFVKVNFRLGLAEAKLGDELAADPVILAATRDKIISILSVKTADEILSLEGKDRLRNEIREKVNLILPKGKIMEVYIMDFVVQL